MKRTIVYLLAGALALAPVWVSAQTEPPPVEPEPVDDGTTTPTDPAVQTPALNATQMEKVQRLSEASGVSEEEIMNLRMGTVPATTPETVPTVPLDGAVVTEPPPQGHGWGVIARWLGLHPGVLGQGTGDKFYPKDGEGAATLPELPELTPEALNAAGAVTLERAGNAVKNKEKDSVQNEADTDQLRDKNRDRTSEIRGKAGDAAEKSKGNSGDKDNKGGSSDKGKPDNGKPDKPDKPNNSNKP